MGQRKWAPHGFPSSPPRGKADTILALSQNHSERELRGHTSSVKQTLARGSHQAKSATTPDLVTDQTHSTPETRGRKFGVAAQRELPFSKRDIVPITVKARGGLGSRAPKSGRGFSLAPGPCIRFARARMCTGRVWAARGKRLLFSAFSVVAPSARRLILDKAPRGLKPGFLLAQAREILISYVYFSCISSPCFFSSRINPFFFFGAIRNKSYYFQSHLIPATSTVLPIFALYCCDLGCPTC